jgi:hypothetical protein
MTLQPTPSRPPWAQAAPARGAFGAGNNSFLQLLQPNFVVAPGKGQYFPQLIEDKGGNR